MQKFTRHQGLVAPMDRENVDTDAIIPKQFLKSIKKTGFGENLFDAWRYLDAGFPGQDPTTRRPNPDFVLNQPRYKGASILLARKNFGSARRANMRRGRSTNMVFAPSLRRVTPTSFSTTASKTACCPSCCRKRKSRNCSTRSRRSSATR